MRCNSSFSIRSLERPLRPGDEAHRRLRDVDGGEVVVLVVRGLEAHRPDALRADELDVPLQNLRLQEISKIKIKNLKLNFRISET